MLLFISTSRKTVNFILSAVQASFTKYNMYLRFGERHILKYSECDARFLLLIEIIVLINGNYIFSVYDSLLVM